MKAVNDNAKATPAGQRRYAVAGMSGVLLGTYAGSIEMFASAKLVSGSAVAALALGESCVVRCKMDGPAGRDKARKDFTITRVV